MNNEHNETGYMHPVPSFDHQTRDARISPCLGAAIRDFYMARRQCEIEPTRQHQNKYCKATDELGQAIGTWKVEQPELFEQFQFWFLGHAEC